MTKLPIRLGEMLVQMGRVTADEVDRALAHQREHGGYMGDALVELGILTRDELWWGLANQYDIPFVHLRAENIDHALAARVPAAWAAEHRMLPVLWDGGRVTVVMPEVGGLERLDEVLRLTGATEAVPALTSPEAIAELIEAVHGAAERVGLAALVAEALERGATGFGVSARPGRAAGWYRAGDDVVRRPLAPDWRAELARVVSPAAPPANAARWSAVARVGNEVRTLECHALASGDATEWAAVPGTRLSADPARVHVDPALVRLAREARRGGGIVARVACEPGAEASAEALLALLPARLLGDDARAIHLSDRPGAAPPGTLAVDLARPLAEAAGALAPFVPDALTVGVETLDADGVDALRRTAPFVAVLARDGGGAGDFDCVVRLRLDGDGAAWMPDGAE
jgi:Type II secretion system (T2SS), protein E, N-terminal domain